MRFSKVMLIITNDISQISMLTLQKHKKTGIYLKFK